MLISKSLENYNLFNQGLVVDIDYNSTNYFDDDNLFFSFLSNINLSSKFLPII